MQNSSQYSVPYIRNLPADWNTKRLKYMVDITTGNRDTVDADDDGEYPFFVLLAYYGSIHTRMMEKPFFCRVKVILEKYFTMLLAENLIFTSAFIAFIISEIFMENISGTICRQLLYTRLRKVQTKQPLNLSAYPCYKIFLFLCLPQMNSTK